jgi:hypothetical protein
MFKALGPRFTADRDQTKEDRWERSRAACRRRPLFCYVFMHSKRIAEM